MREQAGIISTRTNALVLAAGTLITGAPSGQLACCSFYQVHATYGESLVLWWLPLWCITMAMALSAVNEHDNTERT